MQEAAKGSWDAQHAACNDFFAACSSFKDRHCSMQQDVAAVGAQIRSLEMTQKMSEARAALERLKDKQSRAQKQLDGVVDTSKHLKAQCEGMTPAHHGALTMCGILSVQLLGQVIPQC